MNAEIANIGKGLVGFKGDKIDTLSKEEYEKSLHKLVDCVHAALILFGSTLTMSPGVNEDDGLNSDITVVELIQEHCELLTLKKSNML